MRVRAPARAATGLADLCRVSTSAVHLARTDTLPLERWDASAPLREVPETSLNPLALPQAAALASLVEASSASSSASVMSHCCPVEIRSCVSIDLRRIALALSSFLFFSLLCMCQRMRVLRQRRR